MRGGERQHQRHSTEALLAAASRATVEAAAGMGGVKASETEVDHKVMHGCHHQPRSRISEVTSGRSDPEHLYPGDRRTEWKTCRAASWSNVIQSAMQKREGDRERGRYSEQREEAHHDIFCFPTQMAMSPAVRALLSSVQVGGGRAGRGTGLGRMRREVAGERAGYRGDFSRRFIMMVTRLGSGACELLLAAD